MGKQSKGATALGEAPGQWRGEAKLWRLDPPLDDGTAVVVSSATRLPEAAGFFDMFLGIRAQESETMIFAWNESAAEVQSFTALAVVHHLSHEDALRELGYEVSA